MQGKICEIFHKNSFQIPTRLCRLLPNPTSFQIQNTCNAPDTAATPASARTADWELHEPLLLLPCCWCFRNWEPHPPRLTPSTARSEWEGSACACMSAITRCTTIAPPQPPLLLLVMVLPLSAPNAAAATPPTPTTIPKWAFVACIVGLCSCSFNYYLIPILQFVESSSPSPYESLPLRLLQTMNEEPAPRKPARERVGERGRGIIPCEMPTFSISFLFFLFHWAFQTYIHPSIHSKILRRFGN